jgi:hypothetical protein
MTSGALHDCISAGFSASNVRSAVGSSPDKLVPEAKLTGSGETQ